MLRQLGQTVLFVAPVTIMFNDLGWSFAFVSGNSMQPALNPRGEQSRDVVLINKHIHQINPMHRGDVLVLSSPHDPRRHIVKRLVGLPGDWVKSRKGDLKNVPKGKVWIEGDNHFASVDSESYGPVPTALICATVSCVLWPPSRWGRVTDERVDQKDRLFIANENQGDFPKRQGKSRDFW